MVSFFDRHPDQNLLGAHSYCKKAVFGEWSKNHSARCLNPLRIHFGSARYQQRRDHVANISMRASTVECGLRGDQAVDPWVVAQRASNEVGRNRTGSHHFKG